MSVALRAFVVVLLASAIVHAEPKRVLVADSDAELVQAIEWTLQPWKIVVVSDGGVIDPALVSSRAIDANAQFIVWRDASELVVYDRERGITERRPARTGAMDPVSAASAALTVKTMMRLTDPPEEAASAPTTTSVAAIGPVAADDTDVLRAFVSLGVDTQAALRATLGAMYRPSPLPLRVGGALEIASQELERAGFRGSVRDYALLARASWIIPVAQFELEPWVAVGAMLDVVDGKHGQEMRHETALVPTARAGLALWWWHAQRWGVALTANANFALATPTYTRDPDKPNQAVIYDMPGLAGTIALVVAWRR